MSLIHARSLLTRYAEAQESSKEVKVLLGEVKENKWRLLNMSM